MNNLIKESKYEIVQYLLYRLTATKYIIPLLYYNMS